MDNRKKCETLGCEDTSLLAYQSTSGRKNRTIVQCAKHRPAVINELWRQFRREY